MFTLNVRQCLSAYAGCKLWFSTVSNEQQSEPVIHSGFGKEIVTNIEHCTIAWYRTSVACNYSKLQKCLMCIAIDSKYSHCTCIFFFWQIAECVLAFANNLRKKGRNIETLHKNFYQKLIGDFRMQCDIALYLPFPSVSCI